MNDIHAAEARAEISTILSSMGHPAKDIEASTWTAKLSFEGKYWRGALEKRAAWLLEKYPYARQFIVGPQGGLRSGEIDAICICCYLQLVYGSPLGKFSGPRQPRIFGMPEVDRQRIKAAIKQEGGLFG